MKIGGRSAGLLSVLLILAVGTTTYAVPTYYFECISNNSLIDAAIGVAQLSMEVTEVSATQVQFRLLNDGPEASSITAVYFDDNGTLAGIAAINPGPGVAFVEPAAPAELPAANNAVPPFVTSFSAGSSAPVQPNGVNPGEYLDIVVNLVNPDTYADVLAGLSARELRVGLHVQGFASGGSESFVSIPAPGGLALAGIGAMLVGWLRRRQMT